MIKLLTKTLPFSLTVQKINLFKTDKYLGTQIDDKLTFKTHTGINFLYSKLCRTLRVMFKVETLFTQKLCMYFFCTRHSFTLI